MAERRAQLWAAARELPVALGGTGTHPWSRWQDQRIIDTPHYRRNDQLLRYVVWRNNSFGLHVHVGITGADRAVAVHDALRNFLPELLALSASSPLVEGVNSGLHSARTEIFTRMFPRCGVPDAYGSWRGFEDYVAFLYRTGSMTEHTQFWWSVRPHLAYPTIEMRICDAQPDLAEAQAVAALCYALAARCARAVDEGEPLPDLPHRLIEENLWRAIRYGLSGELLDFDARRGDPRAGPARAADRVDAPGRRGDRGRAVSRRPGADVGRAPDRAVRGGRVARARSTPSRCGRGSRLKAEGPQEDFAEQLAALDLGLLLASSASTIASLAYTKLDRGDLDQARLGIDAIAALVPLLEGDAKRDLGAALANLQVAYASRISGGAGESAGPETSGSDPTM